MKKKRNYVTLILILIMLTAAGMYGVRNKLTYIEQTSLHGTSGMSIELNHKGDGLVQEFRMPYDILHGISIKIGTFARDNNSKWQLYVEESESGNIVCVKNFNASLISDNDFFLLTFDKNIRLNKDGLYKLYLFATSVNENTSLNFYYSNITSEEGTQLFYNGMYVDGALCFKIYGGNQDLWWMGIVLFVGIIVGFVIIRAYFLWKQRKYVANDQLIQAMCVGIIAFLLLCPFTVGSTFTDEFDNMRGGMIIAKGGILYKNYITQHTPFAYYLCSIFALLGASSVAQFRICFYIFLAAIWGLIFYRHASWFGRKKMLLLPIMETIFIFSIIQPQGYQLLSDGIQGICMIALLLEFMRYYQDRKLDWSRCLIVSCSIWSSFGSAFVSAYALIWVVVMVIGLEANSWRKTRFELSKAIQRYYKLFIAIISPLIVFLTYFASNHALTDFFEQAYSFNREVYSKYNSGLGERILQPFINAIQYFFSKVAKDFNAIINASATNIIILQFIIAVLAFAIIVMLFIQKRYIESILLFLVMSCSAVRGYDFHALAAWYVAIMIMVLFYDRLWAYMPRIRIPVVGITIMLSLSIYIDTLGNNLLYKQPPVSDMESQVIGMTEDGDGILIDSYSCDSLYFLYKNRYPVNRAVYMLPWYMDWYEQDVINDLYANKPKIVVYNEERETWGYTHYANGFANVLKRYYKPLSDNPADGWKCYIWVKNN